MMLPTLRTLGPDFVHPNSIPERLPLPSMSRPHHISLSPSIRRKSTDPNMFCRSNDQNEFVRDLKSDLFARCSCPDFDSIKISQSQIRTKKKKKRTNRDFLTQVKSDAKAIHIKSCSYTSQFPKTDLVTKRQLICAETDSCLKPIYLFKADSKISKPIRQPKDDYITILKADI
jgi:hypothetical protein